MYPISQNDRIIGMTGSPTKRFIALFLVLFGVTILYSANALADRD